MTAFLDFFSLKVKNTHDNMNKLERIIDLYTIPLLTTISAIVLFFIVRHCHSIYVLIVSFLLLFFIVYIVDRFMTKWRESFIDY